MKKGNKYQITWIDTFGYNGWYEEDELIEKAKEMNQESVGHYITEKYGFVIIAASYNKIPKFARWGAPMWIPRGCIKKIKLLK